MPDYLLLVAIFATVCSRYYLKYRLTKFQLCKPLTPDWFQEPHSCPKQVLTCRERNYHGWKSKIGNWCRLPTSPSRIPTAPTSAGNSSKRKSSMEVTG